MACAVFWREAVAFPEHAVTVPGRRAQGAPDRAHVKVTEDRHWRQACMAFWLTPVRPVGSSCPCSAQHRLAENCTTARIGAV